jgi:hypothetical protein
MLLWMGVGYCVLAVLFYTYIAATAQPEPQEETFSLIDIDDWRVIPQEDSRKAA